MAASKRSTSISKQGAALLLVDVGNSRTKFARSDGTAVAMLFKVPTATLSEAELRRIGAKHPNAKVVCGSVVPKVTRLFRRVFGSSLLEVSHDLDLGLTFDYPKPETLGADRLCNVVAAAELVGSPCVAIDFGTATTFDILGDGKVFAGGTIVAGLDLLGRCLHGRTALLPRINLDGEPRAIGKNTDEAMRAGVIYGYRGLVREILGQILSEMRKSSAARARIPVVATGGDAQVLIPYLPEIGRVIPELTMEGLRIIAVRNLA